jgi:hypothetical protein
LSLRTLTLVAAILLASWNDVAAANLPPNVAALRDELVALSPKVHPREAERVALRAHQASRRLAREYRVGRSPHFHNFLVNVRLRDRGLCHHWARDLMQQLAALRLTTLDLHWGAARAGTLREHNAVVMAAKGQPFSSGVVLDPWRHAGRLFVTPVAADRYPWKEDVRDCLCAARARQRS